MNSDILTIHGLHECSVTLIDKNDTLRIFELERFTKNRYESFIDMYNSVIDFGQCEYNLKIEFLNYIKTQLKTEPKYILYSYLDDKSIFLLKKYFNSSEFINMGHHISHCISSYYQSGFKNALAMSFDGGGWDYDTEYSLNTRSYSIYKVIDGNVETIVTTNTDDSPIFTLGLYSTLGFFISEIKNEIGRFNNPLPGGLSYAGKIMGLVAYGRVREEWILPLEKYYMVHPNYVHTDRIWYDSIVKQFSTDLNIDMYENCLSGKDSYDLAATNQYVFEKICFSFIKPYIEKYNLDVVLSGGCALNVLFNQKLKEYLNTKNLDLFVSPNPGDDGLSLGHYYLFNTGNKNNKPFTVYCGFDILDRDKIQFYYEKYRDKVEYTSTSKIVDLVKDGKIGGIIQGYSEVGPRALGNRSIICDPSIPEMKDIINSKVKFREWFRPFAPVCREEDKDLYFQNAFPSQYMSFAPNVKEEYRSLLPSITHQDGTARLQTVTKDQHQLFYDILTELRNRGHIGVIMNTSFNIKGKPILTTVDDAFYVLENTELDFLVVENLLFCK